jgi:hypothetical protein
MEGKWRENGKIRDHDGFVWPPAELVAVQRPDTLALREEGGREGERGREREGERERERERGRERGRERAMGIFNKHHMIDCTALFY